MVTEGLVLLPPLAFLPGAFLYGGLSHGCIGDDPRAQPTADRTPGQAPFSRLRQSFRYLEFRPRKRYGVSKSERFGPPQKPAKPAP
jgi:hypothetical protein